MDVNYCINILMKLYGRALLWLQASSAAMDLQTIIICGIVFILSALVVYVISVYGMRERTYEEAIEEQRRRNKEALQIAKNEKTRKDKRFKKWNKKNRDRDEDKCVPSDDFDEKMTEQVEPKMLMTSKPFNTEIELKSVNQKKKRRQRKTAVKESLPQPSSSEETDEHCSHSSSGNEQKLEFEEKAINECADLDDEGNKNLAEERDQMVSKLPHPFFEANNEEEADNENRIILATKTSGKRKRRNRSDHGSSNSESSELSASRVVSFLKSGIFTEEELNQLLDVLNCKQGGIGGWTKKNDPIPILKKQIQEKDEALEAEQRLIHMTNEKLKCVRHELNEEKQRYLNTERSLREKINLHREELQAVHATLSMTKEHHDQMNVKLKEEHALILQRVKDENNQLQALNRLESEKLQRSNLDASRLQRELEQMRSAHDQYDKHQAAMQQAQDDLHHKLQQLEKHIEQLMSSHQEEEFGYKQRINELSNKLQQAEKAHTSMVQELQNAQSVCSSLEADNNSLRQRLEEVKHQVNTFDQDRLKRQARIEDLVDCIDRMQSEIMDLTKTNTEQLKQIQELNNEKDSLSAELTENREQCAADRALNVSVPDDQRTFLGMEELEKKIQEKDYIIQHLVRQLDDSAQTESIHLMEEYRWKIQSLSKEVEDQKEANKEMMQSYQNATEALRAASLKAETLEAFLKRTKNDDHGESRSSESLEKVEEQLKESLKRMETVQRETDERLQAVEKAANVRIETMQESLYERITEITAEADAELKKANQSKEALSLTLISFTTQVKEYLYKLYPEIRVDDQIDDQSWILQFINEAVHLKNQDVLIAPSTSKEVKNLKLQMKDILEEKSKLQLQIENYITVLAEAEKVLFKVQNSVEKEEQNWKEEMSSKDRNLKKIMSENERLSVEKQSLEANLEQLQGLREMQSELIDLQVKLQGEEDEKKVLIGKYENALGRIKEMQSKLNTQEAEKNIKDNVEECVMSFSSTGCGEALAPLLENDTSNAPLKSEKRKKPRKRGSTGKK